MRQTKKLTLGAMIIALGVLFMTLGYFVEALDLTVAALLSLTMAFAFIELGSPYTYIIWLATSLLGGLFFTASLVWLTYFLIFGIYPILKAYIERAPKWSWIPIKLLVFNAMLIILIFVSQLIVGVPLFSVGEELSEYAVYIKVGLYVLCNIAFFVYDVFMTVMIRAYLTRLRHRFSRFLR